MMTSEKVRVYVIFGYVLNIYCLIDLKAQCHNVTGVLLKF